MLGFMFRLAFAGMAFYAMLPIVQDKATESIGAAIAMLIGMAFAAYVIVRA